MSEAYNATDAEPFFSVFTSEDQFSKALKSGSLLERCFSVS